MKILENKNKVVTVAQWIEKETCSHGRMLRNLKNSFSLGGILWWINACLWRLHIGTAMLAIIHVYLTAYLWPQSAAASSFHGENKTFFSSSEYWFTHHDVLVLCLASLPTGHGQRQVNLPSYPQLMSIRYSRSTGIFLYGCSSVFHWLKIPSQFLCGDQLISQSIRFKLPVKVHISTCDNTEITTI